MVLFVMQLPENSVLTDEQNNLMLLLIKQISAMLAMEQQNEQQQQLLLMDERSKAIARELHDSIAQSLSCLKMQVSYLQMQSKPCQITVKTTKRDARRAKMWLYRQLRELPTTFRLKLTEPGLLAALENTLNEFNQRLGFAIHFDYQLPANVLIHIKVFMWCKLFVKH